MRSQIDRDTISGPPARWPARAALILAGLAMLLLGWYALDRSAPADEQSLQPTLQALTTALAQAQAQSEQAPAPEDVAAAPQLAESDLGFVIYDGLHEGRRHLWLTALGTASATLLTNGAWEDVEPAVSPNGRYIAFRSDRNGAWDLYLLDLLTGGIEQLTATAGYEGSPAWSPDGRWIVYEAAVGEDLDIWILPLDAANQPIQLTNHPAMDISPTWEPGPGRRIAFISNRDGSPDVFLADLDRPADRLTNLTASPEWAEASPVFHPDGGRLAYATRALGIDLIWELNVDDPGAAPIQIAPGRQPTWVGDDQGMLTLFETSTQQVVQAFGFEQALPSVPISQTGPGLNLDWSQATVDLARVQSQAEATVVLEQESSSAYEAGQGRLSLISLPGIGADELSLVDVADGPFQSLRDEAWQMIGWDFLGQLQYAHVDLNAPLPPGFAHNDWLYTGRAFAFAESALESNRIEIVREDLAGQTFWRVYVRAQKQDGSQGEPLRQVPWDFSARYRGQPEAYDQGGAPKSSVPGGFYVDFTAVAARFGFQRQPALANWRTFLPGARYNEFAFTEGLDWLTAMLQLYPPQAISTPTPFSSPSPTPSKTPWPTPTPWWWRWATPTPTHSPTVPATEPAVLP